MRIPFDAGAEREVVACALATPYGRQLAAERLQAEDFYVPRCRRLFLVAKRLEQKDQDERIAAAASMSGEPLVDLERLVDERAVMFDTSGGFANRVLDAARRRHAMEILADAFNAVGEGAELGDVAQLVGAVLA